MSDGQITPCRGQDPACPCQDGDICHYVDDPKTGTKAASMISKRPFPHAVLDGRWESDILFDIASEFPPYHDPRWVEHRDPKEKGKKQGGPEMWGPVTAEFIAYLQSPHMVKGLQDLFGIDGLVADTIGGGMHCTGEGGRLDMHCDFNRHPSLPGMVRRLNLLVFLNYDWKHEWGGAVQLGRSADEDSVAMLPLFNRTVVFETSDKSWHGHPQPIVGDHVRKSIAVYYWGPEFTTQGALGSTVWA